VDRVTVTRSGDGESALYAYGYSYTVSFWGSYGIFGIPPIIANVQNLTLISVYQNTLRQAQYLGDFSSNYIALDESSPYAVRLRAINANGISPPSEVVIASTVTDGLLPGTPQSLVLGQYHSSDFISVTYKAPIVDGGLPITSYLIEADTQTAFDPESSTYLSRVMSAIPEIQQVTTSFRAGDNVKTRGGVFTLSYGGRTTSPLGFDISAYDLEIALNNLMGTRQVAVPPVQVHYGAGH
jgi:hypothetical protein